MEEKSSLHKKQVPRFSLACQEERVKHHFNPPLVTPPHVSFSERGTEAAGLEWVETKSLYQQLGREARLGWRSFPIRVPER